MTCYPMKLKAVQDICGQYASGVYQWRSRRKPSVCNSPRPYWGKLMGMPPLLPVAVPMSDATALGSRCLGLKYVRQSPAQARAVDLEHVGHICAIFGQNDAAHDTCNTALSSSVKRKLRAGHRRHNHAQHAQASEQPVSGLGLVARLQPRTDVLIGQRPTASHPVPSIWSHRQT